MSAQKYRKKPVTVSAIQWTGDNEEELESWTGGDFYALGASHTGAFTQKDYTAMLWVDANGDYLKIETGEWILADARGFYPCKPDIFPQTYEEVA